MWRYLVLSLAFFLNVAFLSALVWGEHGLAGYEHLRQEYDALKLELEELKEQHSQLERKLGLLKNDDAYIEKMIRKHLKFVKDNEILYDFSDAR